MMQIKINSWYDKVQILHDVNLEINNGEMVSIIGPNGAGKSTILKSIFGLVGKCKGSIMFEGKDIIGFKSHEIVSLGIGYVPQGRSVFTSLTVKENLEMGAYISNEFSVDEMFSRFPILNKKQKTNAGLLSGGEQQLVSLARCLMLKPKLLLLDEPSLGLSPQMKQEIFSKIIEIKESGVTILMVEQNARMSLQYSDRAYVLENGRNKFDGIAKELMHDKKVQHLYLGGVV